jgi:hypothetical protein
MTYDPNHVMDCRRQNLTFLRFQNTKYASVSLLFASPLVILLSINQPAEAAMLSVLRDFIAHMLGFVEPLSILLTY